MVLYIVCLLTSMCFLMAIKRSFVQMPFHNNYIDKALLQCVLSGDESGFVSVQNPCHINYIDRVSPRCVFSDVK